MDISKKWTDYEVKICRGLTASMLEGSKRTVPGSIRKWQVIKTLPLPSLSTRGKINGFL
jgi:hypothetical protein